MWAEENYSFFDMKPGLLNAGKRGEEKFGYGIKEAFMFGKDFGVEYYLEIRDLARVEKEGYKFLTNSKKINLLLKEIDTSIAKLREIVKNLLTSDLKKLSDSELVKLFDTVGAALGNIFVNYSMTQPERSRLIEDELTNYIKGKRVPDVLETINVLTTPSKRLAQPEKSKFLQKTFREMLQAENAKIEKNSFDLECLKLIDNKQTEKLQLQKSLKLSKKIETMIFALSTLSLVRLQMRFTWTISLYYLELFLMELKHRHGVLKADLRKYDFEELNLLFYEGKKVPKETLATRTKGFLKLLHKGKVYTLAGEEAVKFVVEHSEKTNNTNQPLKGRPASSGITQGKVVVFSFRKPRAHTKILANMEPGSILVSEMTRPSLIFACKKAGAIVTDEGGMLSHAAIISREFNIPCIVGVQNATKVLKNGDFVEVDANKGTIKKLT